MHTGGTRTRQLVVDVIRLRALVCDDSTRPSAERVRVLPVCVAVEVGACVMLAVGKEEAGSGQTGETATAPREREGFPGRPGARGE